MCYNFLLLINCMFLNTIPQDYPKVASETWVADTPTLTPYKARTRTLSCALLAQHIDGASESDSTKSPKAVFDLGLQLDNPSNTQTIGGIDSSRDNIGIAYARDTPAMTVDTTSQDECRTPRDHSQVWSYLYSFMLCIIPLFINALSMSWLSRLMNHFCWLKHWVLMMIKKY